MRIAATSKLSAKSPRDSQRHGVAVMAEHTHICKLGTSVIPLPDLISMSRS
jgi:hypothetical protein